MNLTTQEFKDKFFNYEESPGWSYKGDRAAAIRFTASWCQPCKAYEPIYEEVSNETPHADFYTVDVDEEQELAQVFNVRSIPTTVFIPKDGDPQSGAGSIPKDRLTEIVNDILS